ncbi:TIR domain-containing protein [Phenylobacterium sp.]|uniref:TIR domain-containing protein n=1 Tax=Phenylobacterium sp. TaxID=1871053 RepID=UPI002F4265CA
MSWRHLGGARIWFGGGVTGTKIFVSYARPTADRARMVARALEGDGCDVWIDDRLLAHRSFTDAIEEALEAAGAVLVLWSAEAVKSDWVRAEASRAREMGKLVQVRLDGCSLPLPYDQIHCIDLSSWSGDAEAAEWRSVRASYAAVTGHRPWPGAAKPSDAPGQRTVSERRQITTLFCRTADSTSLSSRLDPEDLMLVVEAYGRLCEEVIPRFGGTVAKRLDHGVLAHFGWPRAHEEEGANAVRAGLALCREAVDIDLPADLRVGVQVGIATGLVVVGETAGGTREPNIVGESPHLATQLASLAPVNGVLVAEATQRITDGMFDFRDMGAVTPQDGARPVGAFEVVDAIHVASRSQARARDDAAALFGRAGDLASLRDSWASAQVGAGQVVLVEGEAGIGKSVLVAAFQQTAPGAETAMTWNCGSANSALPLRPVAEALEREAGFERRDGLEVRREKLARWLVVSNVDDPHAPEVLSDLLGISDVDAQAGGRPDADRRRAMTIDLLLSIMARRGAEGPALFVVEDLHWADPTTLDLLDRAVRRAADQRWLIVATARPEFKCGWSEHSDVTHIRLGLLDRADAQRICGAIDTEEQLPAEIVRQILARGDGVPLFIEEITKSVLEALADAGGAQGAEQLPIPSTLQDSLIARLDRLGAAKQVARVGAAIGRRFSYELIAAVAEQSQADLRQALRDLVKSGLVDSSGVPPQSQYVFRQALICDAAYDSLPKRQREALHGRIAAALRSEVADIEMLDPGLLAHHLARAGAIAEAIPLWAQAGAQAAAKAAHFEAVDYLQRALTHLRSSPRDPADVAIELQLLIGLAVSLAAARGYSAPEVGMVLGQARTICDALGNVAGLFAVLRGICAFSIVAGDLETAEQLARRCHEIGLETLEPVHRIEGECALGYVLWAKGRLAEARKHLEASVQLYVDNDGSQLPPVTPQDPLIQCLGPLQELYYAMGEDAAADRASRRLLAHARLLDRTFSHAYGLFWYAYHAISIGEFATALTFAEEAVGLCDRQGYIAVAPHASFMRDLAIGCLGNPAEALEMVLRDVAELNRQGQLHTLGYKQGAVASLHADLGDLAAAMRSIDQAIETIERSGELFWLSPIHRRRAEILERLADSDPEEVDRSLNAAITLAQAQGAQRFVELAEGQRAARAAPAAAGG